LSEIRGLRWARVGGAGLIKAARGGGAGAWEEPNPEEMEGPAAAEAARAVMEGPPERGEIVLSVGSPFPHADDLEEGPGAEDAAVVAAGYAALTALRGPRAEDDAALLAQIDRGLDELLAPFGFAG
jgi:hypothetical protein